jgi:hypothetical protein
VIDVLDREIQLILVPFGVAAELAAAVTQPVTLNGPPNSFCSALSVRSQLSSMLEMSAPNDTLVSVGRKLKRSAWLVAQLWTCPVAFGSDRVIETPFCHVNETSSPTGTERLNVVPSLPCSCEGSTRLSIEKRQSRRPHLQGTGRRVGEAVGSKAAISFP